MKHRGRGRERVERRTPPPEKTGQERRFFGELRGDESIVELELEDGSRLRGCVLGDGPRALEFRTEDGSVRLVPKGRIRMLVEPDEA